MDEQLLYSTRIVELYADGKTRGQVNANEAINAIQHLSSVVLSQQRQIDKLQDLVDQLVTINNNATLSNT